VRHLALAVQRVHRHRDHAQPHAGEEQVEQLEAVGQEERQPVTGADATRRQQAGGGVGAPIDLAEGEERRRVGIDRRVLEPDGAGAPDEGEVEQGLQGHVGER
jgi:hypothetical protein